MYNKIFEFDIIENPDHREFVSSIEKHLNDGWRLHGDLKIISIENTHGSQEVVRYIQALVKETGEEKKTIGGGGYAIR